VILPSSTDLDDAIPSDPACGQKAVLQWHRWSVEVRNVGYPVHHDVRCVSLGETLLIVSLSKASVSSEGQTCSTRFMIPRVNASAATEQDSISKVGCFGEGGHDVINILREPHPNIFCCAAGASANPDQ